MPSFNANAARLDLVHVEGDDLSFAVTVTEGGVAYVSTGATVATDIMSADGTVQAADFTTSWASNVLTVSLADNVSLEDGSWRWRLTVTKSGTVRTWLAGELRRVSAQNAGSLQTTTSAFSLELNGGSDISLSIAGGGGGGASALDDLSDVTITSAASGDLLRFNGSAWVDYPDSNYQAANGYLTDIAAITPSQGDVIYFNGTDWVRLAAGTSGQYLKTLGTGANPAWGDVATALTVQEGDSTVVSAATTLDFGTGFDVTESPSGEANIALDLTETYVATYGKGYINHGSTAGTSRPTGFASIEWHGSVEPSNAIDGDTWVDTA